ncbi:polysaccharide biosynthesis protein [Allostella vacuolata]|nr:polysaccharide biosynthesis protein [Stella vacuolata]
MPSLHARLLTLVEQFGHYAAGLAVRGIEVVGKFGLYVLAAAVLGAHDAGHFFLVITWVGLASTIARMGLERAMTRHIAAELAVSRGRLALHALVTGVGWTGAGAVAMGIGTWVAAEPMARHVFGQPDLAHPLALAALLILPQTLVISIGYALAGLKRGVAAQVVQNALWPAWTLAALAAGVDRLDHLLYALGASLALSALAGIALIVRARAVFADGDAGEPAAPPLPSLWRTALPLGVVEVIQVSLNTLPVLVLGVFVDPATLGAFSIAQRISLLVWVVIISIGTVAGPHFAELHRRGEMAALRSRNRRVRLATAVSAVPPIALMLLAPGAILGVIGPGFEAAAPALVILAAGQLVNCLLPCQDVVLAMTGHGRTLQRLNLLQLVVACILSATLIPAFGMTGAAIVGAVTLAQGAIGTTLAVRRLMPAAL